MAAVDLLSYMFLSITNVLLAINFKHSHFVNKDIYQFLIMIWCVCSFWFIKNLSPKTECEVFDNHEQCSADDWVEQVVVDKLSHKNSLGLVSLKPILPLLEIKLQELIDAFCLTVCFWMKDSWELNINVHVKTYLFPEITDKLRVIIWYNEIKSIIFLIEFCKSSVIYTNSINFPYRHKCDVF